MKMWGYVGNGMECGVTTPTLAIAHSPRTQKQQIHSFLFTLDIATHIINRLEQANIRSDEAVLALTVQNLAFRGDALASFLRATDKVDARLQGVFCKLFQRCFANAAGCAYEDGNESCWEDCGDAGVGGLHDA